LFERVRPHTLPARCRSLHARLGNQDRVARADRPGPRGARRGGPAARRDLGPPPARAAARPPRAPNRV